jgi:glutathione S-transferase
MKLYYSPGACSLSPHIVLREAGIPFELDRVHGGTKKTSTGVDYKTINPLGYVPLLQLDDGKKITEGVAIVQYLADLKPESKLAPAAGSFDRVRLQEWLTFVSSEIHKSFSPIFAKTLSDDAKQFFKDKLAGRFDWLNAQLANQPYLMGEGFTVADAYLFTVLRWTKPVGIDLSKWPALKVYVDRVGARPAVKAALDAESAS